MTRAHLRPRQLPRHAASAVVLCLVSTLLACSEEKPPPPLSLEAIEIDPESASVEAGNSLQLTAAAIYSDASKEDFTKSVSWTSSDPQIVSVADEPRSKGLITGHAPGSVTITARHSATGKSAEI